jgi:hypothetical protein
MRLDQYNWGEKITWHFTQGSNIEHGGFLGGNVDFTENSKRFELYGFGRWHREQISDQE